MKRQIQLAAAVLAGAAFGAGAVLAQAKKEIVHVSADKASFAEIVPGAAKAPLWGSDEKGPYGTFTKFAPGVTHKLHHHSNDLRIVVLRGAYLYESETGEKKRVGPGDYFFEPGGDRHVSGGDPEEGCLFLEMSDGAFDVVFADGEGKK